LQSNVFKKLTNKFFKNIYLKHNVYYTKCDVTITNQLIKMDISLLYFLKDTNLGANLIATLTGLDMDNFTHFVLGILEILGQNNYTKLNGDYSNGCGRSRSLKFIRMRNKEIALKMSFKQKQMTTKFSLVTV